MTDFSYSFITVRVRLTEKQYLDKSEYIKIELFRKIIRNMMKTCKFFSGLMLAPLCKNICEKISKPL